MLKFIEKYENDLRSAFFESEKMQDIANSDEFYFELAEKAYDEFLKFDATNVDIDDLIKITAKKPFSYKKQLNAFNVDSIKRELWFLTGKLVSYFDANAAMKNELNEYDDSRALAKAMVRQDFWMRSLLNLKKGDIRKGKCEKLDLSKLPANAIRNALQYIKEPATNITILSEGYRRNISERLFDGKGIESINRLKDIGIEAKNAKNNGLLYTHILYSNAIKNLWYKYDFLNEVLEKRIGQINQGETDDESRSQIGELKKQYDKSDIVLFLGAGVSVEAKIPDWRTLIEKLLVKMIADKMDSENKELSEDGEKFKYSEMIMSNMENIKKTLAEQSGNSPLIQIRYMKEGFDKGEYFDAIREILYKDTENSAEESKLLKEIQYLCKPERSGHGIIHAIVNYNFDDMVEKTFGETIKHKSIYREKAAPHENEIGIYHVHGFLPRDRSKCENSRDDATIFSEDEYHGLYGNPYDWRNLVQLKFLIERTAVFIGCSMTDPNLRRLLETANLHKEGSHYAFMIRQKVRPCLCDKSCDCEGTWSEAERNGIEEFQKTNDVIQASVLERLNVKVIWYDDHSEVPTLLAQIKDGIEEN